MTGSVQSLDEGVGRFWVHGFCTDLFSVWLRFTPFGAGMGSRDVPKTPPETPDFIGLFWCRR